MLLQLYIKDNGSTDGKLLNLGCSWTAEKVQVACDGSHIVAGVAMHEQKLMGMKKYREQSENDGAVMKKYYVERGPLPSHLN